MSLHRNIKELCEAVNLKDDEHAKRFFDLVFQNRRDADQNYKQSFYLLVLLSSLFVLIASGSVQEASFFSVKLANLVTIQWALPPLMAFVLYSAVGAFAADNYLRNAAYHYWRVHLGEAFVRDLEGLTDPPTFLNVDRLRSRHGTADSIVSALFGIGVSLLMLLGSHAVVLASLIWNVNRWDAFQVPIVKETASIIACLLLVRSAVLTGCVVVEEIQDDSSSA